MRGNRMVSGLFLAALSALFVWAVLTGAFKDFLSDSARFFGIENHFFSTDSSEDVLFDDDSTVNWSSAVTDVFDPSSLSEIPTVDSTEDPDEKQPSEKFYEFALTAEYLSALLSKHSDASALKNISASFAEGEVILSGDADVSLLTEQMDIPAALVIFLPESVPCTLHCVPEVSEGRLKVSVTKVSAGSDVLTPFLSQPKVLSSAEDLLNRQLTKYLSSDYKMQSSWVTKSGMYVRFSVK